MAETAMADSDRDAGVLDAYEDAIERLQLLHADDETRRLLGRTVAELRAQPAWWHRGNWEADLHDALATSDGEHVHEAALDLVALGDARAKVTAVMVRDAVTRARRLR